MAEYPRLQVSIASILEEYETSSARKEEKTYDARISYYDATLPRARNIHEPMPDHQHCHEHISPTDEPVWTNSLGGWPLYCKGCVWIQLTRNSKFGSRIGKMRLAYQLMEDNRLSGLDPADDAHCLMLLLHDVTGI